MLEDYSQTLKVKTLPKSTHWESDKYINNTTVSMGLLNQYINKQVESRSLIERPIQKTAKDPESNTNQHRDLHQYANHKSWHRIHMSPNSVQTRWNNESPENQQFNDNTKNSYTTDKDEDNAEE